MSVDSAAAAMDAPLTDTAVTAPDAGASNVDAELSAIYNKHERDNGAERGADGRFASTTAQDAAADSAPPAGAEEPLEGGGGEDAGDTESTPQSTVPLPSSMRGLDDVWSKIPEDLKKPIADHQNKLHKTLSEQGQALSAWKPLSDIINKNKDYFDGTTAQYKPEDAINAMFETVRQLDKAPVETLVQIATEYDVLPQLAAAFRLQGEDAAAVGTQNAKLLAEIGELKQTIVNLQSGFKPEEIDRRVRKTLDEERTVSSLNEIISRVSQKTPLFAEIESELPDYIRKAAARLDETASHDAVLELACDMAVNADPGLRARAAALKGAAVTDAGKVAAQKAANAANIKSTSSGKPRDLTDDELLGGIYDKHRRA